MQIILESYCVYKTREYWRRGKRVVILRPMSLKVGNSFNFIALVRIFANSIRIVMKIAD